ncbi:MAG: hypothetical protein AMJ69_04000 [Gammaproteobacteria bacterium SG8_47]|nr:MAG: hypothetical protein AMJ69_04000 [Gammaproteobacteria bacterium SG8_47]
MSLLSILLALLIEHFFGPLRQWRRFEWFIRWGDWIYQHMPASSWRDGPLGVIALLGVPLFVLALVLGALDEIGWLLSFPFGVVVLLYCLEGRDFEDDIEAALSSLDSDDPEAAFLHARGILSREVVEAEGEFAAHLRRGVLVFSNERLFAPLFWFLVLGPLGAVLFRLTCVARSAEGEREVDYRGTLNWLHTILVWPAARLLALGYALGGNFVDAMAHWHGPRDFFRRPSDELLVDTGLGALGQGPAASGEGETSVGRDAVRETLALVRRTVVVWITALAILTLAGWAA